jgi:hypothetical protein
MRASASADELDEASKRMLESEDVDGDDDARLAAGLAASRSSGGSGGGGGAEDDDDGDDDSPQVPDAWGRWRVLFLYSYLSALQSLLWMTFSSVPAASKAFLGVDDATLDLWLDWVRRSGCGSELAQAHANAHANAPR